MTLSRRVWWVANVIGLLLMVLAARIVYWQMIRGDEIRVTALNTLSFLRQMDERAGVEKDRTGEAIDVLIGGGLDQQDNEIPLPVIQRVQDLLATIHRGEIFDRNGRLLAYDHVLEEGPRVRVYTEPSLAHVVGYLSGLRTGIFGLEYTYNDDLLGLNRIDSQLREMTHQEIVGSDLVLTVDSYVQRTAEDALAGRPGAIVALDGHTGAVLAMATYPRFDPNRMNDPEYVAELAGCQGEPDCAGAFINRATQALYPPGSTWKTVTLIASLDSGQVKPNTVFDFGQRYSSGGRSYYIYTVDGFQIIDPNHTENRLNLEMSYAKSANAAFARLGDEMPPGTFIDYANRFGFQAPGVETFPLEIEFVPPQLAQEPQELAENNVLRAVTAFGQGELLAHPLSMARVVLTVLNEGNLPLPYLVESVRGPNGSEVPGRIKGDVVPNLMSARTARQVHDMMVSVVQQGSGRTARISGATVGGKTGTAQVGGNRQPHAWFIGFAEENDRSVVVAVLIENSGEGSLVAGPVFARVAAAALRNLGTPVEEIVPPPGPEQAPPPEPQKPQAALTPDIPGNPNAYLLSEMGAGYCRDLADYPVLGTGSFVWPTEFHKLVGGDFVANHPAIDLGAPPGAPIVAADAGVVIYAGWSSIGYGNMVVIDHGRGLLTLYAHLSSVRTSCGAQVQAGELIGFSGNSGKTFGPHLHFEIRVPGGFLNPWNALPPP